MTARAVGAFSGGLDGMIAARLLAVQGIDLLLVTFSSPFFGPDQGRRGAALLSATWREEDFTSEIMALLDDPPSGFGSCLNPCIDCHAAMIRRLGAIMEAEGFDFVFTGEVLGQRPMSQSRPSLNRVAKLSGLGDRLLRPLSAKLLPPTLPETSGMVDRERLLGLSGRGRKPQIGIARAWGLEYPPPAGGCLLTDPGFSRRISALRDAGLLTAESAVLAGMGRMFRLAARSFLILGRDSWDNDRLEASAGGRVYTPADIPGPSAVLLGEPAGDGLPESLVALYARVPQGGSACIITPAGDRTTAAPAAPELAERLSIR